MGQYLPLVALLVLTGLFGGLSIMVSRLFNPPRPTAPKTAPYECGIVDQTPPPERFPVLFYLIAMIFIVFDIEIVFLYPYSMVFRELGGFGLAVVAIYAVAVFESFLYLISNGALDWGPLKRLRYGALDAGRTTRTTVRRVGLEGRDTVSVLSNPIIEDPTPGEAA